MTLDEIKNVIGLKDIILDVMPLSDSHHPASVEPCLVMIKAVGVDRVCTIHIDTYDSSVFYTKSMVSKFLNKLKNRIFCFSKRKVLHQLNVNKLYDLCLVMFMETGEIIEQDEYNTAAHSFFKNKYTTHIESNKIIPKYESSYVFLICGSISSHISSNLDM